MDKKVVYIAHPISGDVENNLLKLKDISFKINKTEKDIVPFIPYFVDCSTLDDSIKSEREKGIANSLVFFERGIIDEVRLYGSNISNGMKEEINLANKYRIPIKDYTNINLVNKKCICNIIDCEHVEFYNHLKKGKSIQRDDKLNNISEILTPELIIKREGCLCKINLYGYETLRKIY